jgi:hypothetical protein
MPLSDRMAKVRLNLMINNALIRQSCARKFTRFGIDKFTSAPSDKSMGMGMGIIFHAGQIPFVPSTRHILSNFRND